MTISILAQNNDELLGLHDILSAISNCIDISDSQFMLYFYEYHLAHENQIIPERLMDYLMNGSDEGIELDYNEVLLLSNFIFQSIEGKIDILLIGEKGRIELEIIDGDLWELSFYNEELSSCFLKNAVIKKFKIIGDIPR